MISKLKNDFRNNPSVYYAMSIAATWANAGSLLNGIAMARGSGILPFLLWAIGNTLACIVFGIFAPMIPRLRDVFRSRTMKIVMGIMCPFQCWVSMNGIQSVFSDTLLGAGWGAGIAFVLAVFFIAMLYKLGMIRNVLTDHMSWIAVYVIIFGLTIVTLFISHGDHILLEWGAGAENIGAGIVSSILLIPGAFLYPYYYELLDYNNSNEDGTVQVNIRRAFIVGGLIFGIYLVFVFLMSLTALGPILNIINAVLVTLVAASSLSSFQYSIYLTFGRVLGLGINVLTVALWQFLIPLGVMGAWTLMASIRIYIVAAAVIAALGWHFTDKKREVQT